MSGFTFDERICGGSICVGYVFVYVLCIDYRIGWHVSSSIETRVVEA